MELGNAIFGNSRGMYSIERDAGFESQLMNLFRTIGPEKDEFSLSYGVDFENSTFMCFPYYWGDCTCGYVKKEWTWCEENKHRSNCYQNIEYAECQKKNGYEPDFEKLKRAYKKYGWDTESKDWYHGWGIRCSCDYNEKWHKFIEENAHADNCPIIKPNFLYKPTGLEIQWYKYPLRDAYSNHKLDLQKFKVIIKKCIESLNKK